MQGTRVDRRKRIIFEVVSIILIATLIVVDQLTKRYFSTTIEKGNDIVIIENFFYFTFTINTGAAWSFLTNVSWSQIFFKVITVVALALFAMFYLYAAKKGFKWLRFAIIFVISGTVGNFIDRLAINGVIDFIGFIFWGYNFPIFNLADSFLVVGVIMMIIHFFFFDDNAVFKSKNGNEEVSNK